jgi:hypothetical protein
MNTLTAWKLVSARGVPEYKMSIPAAGSYESAFRETETRVYAVYVPADEGYPTAPVNPAGLSPVGWTQTASGWTRIDSWVCEDRGFDTEYASPAPKLYRETWTKVGSWRKQED